MSATYGSLTWTTEAQIACKALQDRYGIHPAKMEAAVGKLVGALRAMKAAAPQKRDTTTGHQLYLANRLADKALARRKEASHDD